MFTPAMVRHRKNLRDTVTDTYPNMKPDDVFDRIRKPGSAFIEWMDLEQVCEKANCPAAVLEDLFAPYGTKALVVTKAQWEKFLNEGFPVYKSSGEAAALCDRHKFLLVKFIMGMKTKFGATIGEQWNASLARNPPNTINTILRISALCHLFQNMNWPFAPGEFVDALFAFYGEKVEELTYAQFSALFNAFS